MPNTTTSKTFTPPAPCRLYVLLACAAPVAVIFRRGPSKWVQIVRWDTTTDTFTSGQWFHGRIYERDSRLSADGTLLRYSALKLNQRTLHDPEVGYAWEAISKPPFLTALVLWAWGRGGQIPVGEEWRHHWEQADKPQTTAPPLGLAAFAGVPHDRFT